MSDREREEAERLAAYLDGEGQAPTAEDAEAVGLLRSAREPGVGPDPAWERIRARAASARGASAWAWAGYAVAASAVIGLLMWPASPPVPPGATEAQRQAAIEALDPASGPPLQRLAALHRLAGAERARLVATLERDE